MKNRELLMDIMELVFTLGGGFITSLMLLGMIPASPLVPRGVYSFFLILIESYVVAGAIQGIRKAFRSNCLALAAFLAGFVIVPIVDLGLLMTELV